MQWAAERKLIYALLLIMALSALGVYGFRDVLFPKATCSDQKQNGFEEGIDCGGLCSRVCIEQVAPITTLWSRAVPVTEGLYDIAALISSRNQGSAPTSLEARFTVLNASGTILYEKIIQTTPPTTGDLPVIIQNVELSEKPQKVLLTLREGTYYRIADMFQSAQISTVRTNFENGDTPRLYATIRNITRNQIIDFPVRVVLYDATQNVIGVGETQVSRLNKEEEETLVFTWKKRFDAVPVTIKVYPVFDPFRGY
jgi:hypothetical protein